MKRTIAALMMAVCLVGSMVAQDVSANNALPKPGTMAPPISFTKVLGAPAGTRVSLASLKGKVVVLEFWATWCAPCIGEIPVVNRLVSSLDPAKVQFISVDDEDPAKVEAFLKKTPMKGWVGLDSTGKIFENYKVNARPATIVIGPDGRIVSSSVHPENLKREKLLALAAGKKTDVSGTADAKVMAERDTAMKQAFAEQAGPATGSEDGLFDLRVSAGVVAKPGEDVDTHQMMLGEGKSVITNGSIETLLAMGAGIPSSRMKVVGKLPETLYNLSINAPHADKKMLNAAIEMALASVSGVGVEAKIAAADVYVMTALPSGAKAFAVDKNHGFAVYDSKNKVLICVSASADAIASGLEGVLGRPVVNESGLVGNFSGNIPIAGKELASANEELGKGPGVVLAAGSRPVESLVLTAPVADAVKIAEKADGGK